MNKYFKMFVIVLLGVILTGCGSNKKITCTVTENDSSKGEAIEKAIYQFSKDGKKIEKYTEETSFKYNNRYLEYKDIDIERIYKETLEECDDYKNYSIVTCKVTTKGNKVTQTLTYNLKGLVEDDVKEMYDDKEINYTIYSKVKTLLSRNYDDLKKDINDKNNSLYIYGCK